MQGITGTKTGNESSMTSKMSAQLMYYLKWNKFQHFTPEPWNTF